MNVNPNDGGMTMAAETTTEELAGRVALVTGAGRGIGRVTALLLAARGAKVGVVDLHRESGAETVRQIEAAGGSAVAVAADVSDPDAVDGAVAEIAAALGPINVLVANHTLHPCGTVLETEPEEWDRLLGVNLRGTFLCARAVLPGMIEAGEGVLVGLASDCVIRTCRNAAAYVASKAGIAALMRSMAVDHGPAGVRSVIVTPGVTRTEGLQEVYTKDRDLDESVDRAQEGSPLGRIGEAADVAEAIAWIVSDRAAFINGAELVVDGGMTLTYSGD
jgi:NAD(P)-dependent dehydrogenase (short-subunit alcohol dehydrogenase family)